MSYSDVTLTELAASDPPSVLPPATVKLPGILTLSAGRPRTTVLLVETIEPAPIAVANVRLPEATFDKEPIIVLLAPVELLEPARIPKNEF